MQIQVISCSKPEWKEKPPKSKWQEVVLTFSTAGKTQTKKFMSFSPIFNNIKEMEANEVYDVVLTKNEKSGYWDWVSVEKTTAGASAVGEAPRAVVARPSTYETAEERAIKQIYIVRQSSINQALEYSKAVKALKSEAEVLALAKVFEDHVFRHDAMDDIINMEDDIPM